VVAELVVQLVLWEQPEQPILEEVVGAVVIRRLRAQVGLA
jgi:hypothetical protein